MSSGSIPFNQSPVPLITTRDFAFLIQAGWLFSGASQAKNM